MAIDPMQVWRHAKVLSVVEAAALLVGADPDKPAIGKRAWRKDDPESIVYFQEGFETMFGVLRRAVTTKSLPAKFAYTARLGQAASENAARRIVVVDSGQIEFSLQQDVILPLGEGFEDEWADKLVIERSPDWSETTIKTADLKAWLHDMALDDHFFATSSEQHSEDFMNANHPRFAPELALAVEAWRSMGAREKFVNGPKHAILKWIEDHPEAWKGAINGPSVSAKERIATLANWNPAGGAPKSGG